MGNTQKDTNPALTGQFLRPSHRQGKLRPAFARAALALLAASMSLSMGCAKDAAPAPQVVESGGESFNRIWRAPLPLEDKRISAMHLLDDRIVLTTTGRRVFSLSRDTGAIQFALDLRTADELEAPLIFKGELILPDLLALHFINSSGKEVRTLKLDTARRGAIAASNDLLFIPGDARGTGRILAIDPAGKTDSPKWELIAKGGLVSRPVFSNGVLYFASDAGHVTATTAERTAAWPLSGSTFKTDGRVLADLVVDDSLLYVAATDSKLYAIEKVSGKLRWQYLASEPLTSSPIVTPDTIYQYVPRTGLVAIDKSSTRFNQQPKWVSTESTQFLSSDDKYVYVRLRGNALGAVNKETGKLTFRSQRSDLDFFASNTRDAVVYAATALGEVLAIRPVLRPGLTGEVVLEFRNESNLGG